MKKERLFIACILGLVHLATAPADAQVYGVGDLPGGIAYSEIRDAARVNGVIYAVGGSVARAGSPGSDTGVLWRSDTGALTPLPVLIDNAAATSFVTASAITPDAAYIGARARAGATNNLRSAVRVTRNGLVNLNLTTGGGVNGSSAISAISANGEVLYGFGPDTTGLNRTFRFTATGPTATALPFLDAAHDNSFPTGRAISADGSVMLGTSYVGATTQGGFAVAGNNAYRYVHGVGTSAIPKLSGGTWNGPLALTPDGVTSLVTGNGGGYTNGAVYLHNATTGAITVLGTPNAAWSSSNFAGITADASVAVVSFGSNLTTSSSQYAYFRNSHGWFHLKSAVAALHGAAAVAAWEFGNVFGISPDGTLVFGMGQRNGAKEGYVIDLPAGYLANYNPAPVAPAQSSIVGAWALGDPATANAFVIFAADGTYFHLEQASAEDIANGGATGFERGRYYWNAATGAFSVVTLSDSNGDIGLSGSNGTTGSLATVAGNTLTFTPPGESAFQLTRVTSASSALVGAWSVKDAGINETMTAVIFLADGRYFLADDGKQELSGGPGLEIGTYTWNSTTGALTAVTTVDLNGDWGLSSIALPAYASVSLDQRGLIFADAGESVALERIAPAVASPITTQPANVSVTSGTNATFSVFVTGAGPYTYQWRRNGLAIAGANSATYTITGAKRADADRYDVIVSDGANTFVSTTATLSVAPTAYPGQVAYDPTFNPDPVTISTRIYAALQLPDGKWMVGGEFSKWGSASRTFLARLNADYTLDSTFVPPVINGFVYAIARDAAGRLYVGGEFTHADGHRFPRLFRLNSSGALDLTWQPNDSINAAVTALAVDSNARVLVARQNTFSGGQITTGGTNVLTRLTPDGELDSTFSVNIGLGTNRLNGVFAESSGSVVFYGAFGTVNGAARNGIARVSVTGVLDTAFGGTTGANNQVFSAVRLSSGGYLIGGTFTTIGGVARNRVAIINADGAVNTTFVPVGNNGNILGVAAQADGKIFISGAFNLVNGQASYGLARLTAAGAVDTLYASGGAATSFATSTAQRAMLLFPQTDGSLAFFGSFQSAFNQRRVAHGVLAADGSLSPLATALLYRPAFTGSAYALRSGQTAVFGSIDAANGASTLGQAMLVNDNGSLDSSFPQGTGFTLNGLTTFGIYRAVRQGDDKFVAVGDLSGYNGTARTRILRVAGDGTFDPTFNGQGGPSTVFPGIFALSGGRTLVANFGTGFTYAGVAANGLIRLRADGLRDPLFVPRSFTPAAPSINWAYEQTDGKLVVSGNFTAYDGNTVPGLMRLNVDGSRDTTFNPGSAAPGGIGFITGLLDGRLVIAGGFTTFNGAAANRVVVLQPDGTRDASFVAPAAINGTVAQVLPQEDGKLLLVGDFTDTPGPFVVRLNANGTIDDTFALLGVTGGVGSASRIFLGDDGSVYLHANPASLNYGTPVAYARFRGAATAPTISAHPQSLSVAVGAPAFLFVQVSGTGPFTYQWRRNGVNMDDATNSFIGTDAIDGDGNATFDVVITGPGGTVTSNPATITVTGMTAPAIVDQPRASKVVVGGKLVLRVGVTGTAPYSYEWRKGGNPLPNATGEELVIDSVIAGDAGNYDVVVTNAVGSITSATAAVSTVTADAVLWQQFTEYSTEASPARIIADGTGKLYVPWTVNARISDVVGGRVQGALVRLFEDGSIDTNFRVDPRISAVRHVALQPDFKVVGSASYGDAHRVVRFLSDGQTDATFTSPVFARGVRFVTRQADGKILVAATDNLSAAILPNALAIDAPTVYRLNADGSYDSSFTPTVLNAGAVLFSSPVVDSSGRIYLAGAFNSVNGTARANVARVNADGSVDTTFAATLPAGWISTQARGVGLQSDGRAVFVGDFRYTARGTSANPIMAVRFNTDGSFDSTFAQPLRADLGLDAVTSARLRWIEVRNNDTFYAVSNRVIRFNADGTRDLTFTSRQFGREAFWFAVGSTGRVFVPDVPSVAGSVVTLPVAGIAALSNTGELVEFETGGWGRTITTSDGFVLPDGRVWMAGQFNRYGSARVPGLAQFTASGLLTGAQANFPLNSPAGAQAQPFATLASAGGSQVFVAWMNSANTINSAYQTLVRLNSDASVDATFNAVLPSGYNLGSSALAASPGGKLVLSQASVTAQAALNGATGQSLLRLNANGSSDTSFTPGLSSFATVERDANNNVTMIRTGGLTVNQVLADSRLLITVAAIDGNLRVQRLNADGTLDAGFNAPTFGSVSVSSGFTAANVTDPVKNVTQQFAVTTYFASNVIASARQVASGKVYVGGNFQLANSPRGLVRLNSDGTLDATFNPGGVGVSYNNPNYAASVLSIAEDAFGYVYIAGRFDAYNGVARAGIARLRPDGSLDTAWTAGLAMLERPYAGNALQVLGEKLYVFGPAGATTDTVLAPFRVVNLPPAPTISVQPVSANFSDGTAQSLSVQASVTSGTITYQWYLNGNLLSGQTASTITFNPVTAANVGTYTVVVTANGNSVTSAPAVVTVNLTGPAIVDQPSGHKVPAGSRVLFRVTATGSAPLSYEWRRNGTPVANGNTADLTVGSVSTANAGNYTVVVTNAQGSVESAVAPLESLTPDTVLWQQFNDYNTENAPSRIFSDGAGRLYVPWTVNDRSPDMVAGKFAGALARFDEATGAYDPAFRLPARYRRAQHMAQQPDGKLVIAVTVGDCATIIRVDSTGAIDPTFNAPFFARSVRFITRQADGKILAAAVDVLAANAPAGSLAASVPQLHRLNADGSLDASFTPATIGGTGLLYAAPAVDSAGRIYLAGSFNNISGTARTNVARLNANGSVDTTYAATLPAGFASTQARGVDLQSDGRAVFVGDFQYTGRGSGDPIQAIRFNLDGSFDTTFAQPLRSQLGLNPAVGARLRHVTVLADNKLVAVSTRLVRLNADGSVDTTFASRNLIREGFWVTRGTNGGLYVPDQTSIASANGSTTLPVWDQGIVKFGPNGSPDFTFQTGGFGRVAYANSGRVATDGTVWLAGSFNRFGSAYVPGVAHLSTPSALAGTQAPIPTGANAAFTNVPLVGIASAADNKTYVLSIVPTSSVGPFFSALRRLNADGTDDATFVPVLPSGYNLGSATPYTGAGGKLMLAQGAVAAQAALNGGAGDALIRLNLDGSRDTGYTPNLSSFATVERDASNAVTMIRTGGLNIAQVLADGRALVVVSAIDGNLRLIRLNADGTLDATFNAPSFGTANASSGFTPVGLTDPQNPNFVGQFPITTYSAADLIRTAVQMPDGKVYVGGRFSLAGSPRGLVRLNADGSLDSTFTGAGIAFSAADSGPYVTALAADTSGRLYAAGRFTSFNGTAVNGLFRLNVNGTLDAAWAPGFSVVDAPVATVQLTVANNKLYAFGTVATATSTVPPPYAVVDIPPIPTITTQPVATNLPENGGVSLFVNATGTGTLTYQWYRDGVLIPNETFSSIFATLAGSYTVTVSSAGGSVTSAPAIVTVVPSVALFNATGNNLFGTFGQVVPAGTSALITASPTAGTQPIIYQWQLNGTDIPGATMGTYYVPNWQPEHAGNYTVRATNSVGTTTSPADRFYVTPEGGWRWRNPAPTGNGLTRGAFLNGEFLVGGLRGTLLASTDGLTWTQRAVPAANNLFAFYYVNDTYVAMGSLNAIFTSPDAIVWTPRTTGIDGGLTSLQDMTAGGGRIVAVGTGGVTSTSTDGGRTWTRSTIGVNDTLFGATYVLNKFFAVSGDTGRVFSSVDGMAWTSVTTPAPSLRNMTYGAGRLVAVGDAGMIVTSTNGTTWTQVPSGSTASLIGVNFVNNQFVVTGTLGTILTSADGLSWATRSSNGNQSNLQNTIYGNGRYVIVGQGGNTGRTLLTSTDGVTWTSNITGPYQGTHLLGVATSATTAVAVGNGGAIVSSADLATWTQRNSGSNQNFNDVAYGGGKFVAVGSGGAVTVSSDGATWTLQGASTVLGTNGLNGIRFTGTQWIVTGNGGAIYTAPDALPFVWTQRSTGTGAAMRKVTSSSGLHVAVGATTLVYTSPDAVTWTSRNTGTNVQFFGVAHGNGTFVAVGNAGTAIASTDGTTWTNTKVANAVLTSVTFLEGTFIATAANHTYYTSTDGVNWSGRFTGAFDPLLDTAVLNNQVVGVGNFGTILTAGTPTIASPIDFTVSAGQAATFKFAVAESAFPVTYTWTKNNSPLPNAPNYPILTIPAAVAGDAGEYRLTATNAFGSTTSEPVTLTLNVGITITTQPASQTVIAGGSATFSVVAIGTPAPIYQWRLGGVDVPGANGPSLRLADLRPIDTGLVTVVLTNATGTVTSEPAQLTVNPVAPVITSPLAAFAVANVPFTYQIATNQTTATFNATPLPAGLSVNATTGVIEGTPTTTGVFNLTLSATNVTGSDTKTLQLAVQPPAPTITSPASASGRVNVAFSYTITASNNPTDFLAFNLPPGVTRTGAVLSGTPTAAGFYSTNIVAINATGQNSRTLTIQIAAPLNAPVFTGSSTPSVIAGAAFNFTPNFGPGVTNYSLVNLPSGAASVLPTGLTLDAATGVISGTTSQLGTFSVAVRATNADGSTTQVLTFTVNPAPSAPRFTSNSSVTATVGTPFSFTLTTTPTATNFAALGLPAGLTLSGATISGTPTTPGISSVALSASNADGASGATLLITVNSAANAPVLTSAPIANGRVNTAFNFQLAATNAPNLYTIITGALPAGLSLDGATGAITGTPTAAGQSSVWIAASNAGSGRGPAAELVFIIERSLNVPVITSNGTAAAQVGRTFQYQITATNTPTAFAAAPLPDGLSLQVGGIIAGIPSSETSQPFEITLTATNPDGTSAPKVLSLTVAAAPATPRITSSLFTAGRAGTAFSYQMTATPAATSFAIDALPAGLEFNSTTGLISGTPTVSGSFTAQIRAANADGLGRAETLTFTFAAPLTAPVITSEPTAGGKVGVLFNYTIVASGSPTSYAVSGTLPLGVTLNTTTGVISGVPADDPGLYNVTLTASNASGPSQPQPLVIAIDPADNVPVITSATSATATVGVDFIYQITATNVPLTTPFPPSVFLDAVNLPPGLAVNPSTGVIQGRPSEAGSYLVILNGVNGNGTGLPRALTITVNPAATAPVVNSPSNAAAQVGVAFSYQIAATNSPTSFEALDAPAWLTVNTATGLLSGTPTSPGSVAILLRAANSGGASNLAPLSLSIAAAPNTPVIAGVRTAPGRVGNAFAYDVTATVPPGQPAPTSYRASGLPPMLSIDATTGAIRGTPTVSGTYNVTISATNANGEGQPVTLTITISASLSVTPSGG